VCTDTGTDPGPDPVTKKCIDGSWTWGTGSVTHGKVTGTCTLTTGGTETIYGCKDGYYVANRIRSSAYSFVTVECTPCPQHSDHYNKPGTFIIGAPAYVTTGNADKPGVYLISDCQIKAGADIPDVTGTFHYDTACTHEGDGGLLNGDIGNYPIEQP